MAYIYKISNDINNKVYIGKTTYNIQKRWKEHCNDLHRRKSEKRPLYDAFNKYGIENFKIEKLEYIEDDSKLSDREIYWINELQTYGHNGYNATKGGDGVYRIDYTEVIKNYNIYHNRTKVAEVMGISLDSVTTILKNNNINFESGGQVMAQKTGQAVACYDITTGALIKIFDNYSIAARWLIKNNYTNSKEKTAATHISEVARGKRKTTGGFTWKRI